MFTYQLQLLNINYANTSSKIANNKQMKNDAKAKGFKNDYYTKQRNKKLIKMIRKIL